ncbi:hypothetical protein EC1_13480 [Faecalitalea cylindroides T2-87]|uniref:Uncharacterized protein n=1 Tax=Faecalitalea cylindroides T2-87 TaxID=717960 RepID=D4JEZ4_9FIRM|nr:hypothetical protein EC1_13480 [Faecalitalea cylindroides T2-87]
MTLILLIFFCLCITGVRVDFFNRDYISRDTTIQINGIFGWALQAFFSSSLLSDPLSLGARLY